MKYTFIILLSSILCLFSCNQPEQAVTKTTESATNKEESIEIKPVKNDTKSESVGNIPVYDFKGFEPLLHINNDTTYVVNFWATWCKPCVAELPYFEQLNEQYKNQKVKVLLVSLDFSTQIEKKLNPFLERKQLKSEVVVLDDPDANGWIDKVDPKWSGAIPATVIYQGDKRAFYEESFEHYEDLEKVFTAIYKQ